VNDVENSVIEETVEAVEENSADTNSNEKSIDENSEISALRMELEGLRAELRARDESEKLNSRMLAEITEFQEYFPEVDIHQISNEVWEKVKNGVPLSASFALSLHKMELEKKKVSDFNEKNRRMSAGSLMQGEGEKYYSPAEVKKMTPAQVKSHYDEIVASMRHWN
jgi:hypothetical protein